MKSSYMEYEVTYTDGIACKDETVKGICFFFDGCHKFYVAQDEVDIKNMEKIGGYEKLPMKDLEETFMSCECELKFINTVELDTLIPQGYRVKEFMGVYSSEPKEV